MSNHINRSRRSCGRNPRPDEIRQARLNLTLTVKEAAATVWSTASAWAQWEAGDRRMHAATWELFCRKTKQEHLFNPGAYDDL